MVDLPDSMTHGHSPRKQDRKVLKDETIESIKHALASKGLDDRQSFAFIRLDEDGKVRVHASGQVKGFLDEQGIDSIFQDAIAKGVHEEFVMPEPTSAISIDDEEGSDYGDEEFPLVPQTFESVPTTRVYRTARQRADRGRSMLPCNASRHCPIETYLEPEQVQDLSPSEPEEETVKPKKISRTYRIDDTTAVCDFLAATLKRMQQLAVKKIAKAWIKGICPKKQAKFPYQNKKGEEIDGFKPRVPGWWPDTKDCRFIEPDHIRRDERMRLCLHLLRLRPTPAQLKEWNEDKSEPHPIHVTEGWTRFLAELAGVSIFEELQKEDKKRTDIKKDLLTQMYDVAEKEEGYLNGERDPDTTFNWVEHEEDKKTLPAKRPFTSAIDFKVERSSRESSESGDCKRIKRSRRNSTIDDQFQHPVIAMIDGIPSEGPRQSMPSNAALEKHARQAQDNTGFKSASGSRVQGQYDATPMKRDSSAEGEWRHVDSTQGHWADQGVTQNLFQTPASTFAMPDHWQAGHQVPSSFGSHPEYAYPQHPEQQHMVRVHQAHQIPEPQFQPVSSAPMYSPSGMMPMALSNFMPQECVGPACQPYSNSMAPSQYFVPSNVDPSVGEFQAPPSQPFQGHHELARQHIAPNGIHGLPFTQPSSWEGRPFNGQCHNPA